MRSHFCAALASIRIACWFVASAVSAMFATMPAAWAQPSGGNPPVYDPTTGQWVQWVPRQVDVQVPEQVWENQAQTVYRPVDRVEYQDQTRTAYQPRIDYYWQPRWHGTWNPFRQPTLAYHLHPVTNWELRSQQVKVPTTRTEFVQETRNAMVLVPRMRTETRTTYDRIVVQPPAMPRASPSTTPSGPPSAFESQYAQNTTRDSDQMGMRPTVLAPTLQPPGDAPVSAPQVAQSPWYGNLYR
jgi:hypothetical protein